MKDARKHFLINFLAKSGKFGRAECVRCPWLLTQTKVATILGIFRHVGVLVLVTPIAFTPEGIVVGFYNLAWATK